MKRILLSIVLFIFLLASCNQPAAKQEAITDSTTIKLNKKPLSDSFPDFQNEDTNYQNADLTVSLKEWQNFKAIYKVSEKNLSNMYDNKSYEPEMIKGDFNGDGKTEFMFIVPPHFKDTLSAMGSQQCYGGCNSFAVFSNSSFPILKIINNLGGAGLNVGDLDGDGGDDILVYPDWWQSNWNPYKVFSFNKLTGKWNYLVKPVSIFANELERKILIRKSARKGFVNAFTSASDEEGNVQSSFKDLEIIKK